jgi:rRNA maturation protein Nop10
VTAPVALLALLPLAARDAPSRPPVPFEQRGKWGYRDTRGAVVIPPRFDLAKPFSPEGLAAVVDNQGWAYIDTAGKLVIRPLVFDNGPDYFRENLARFTEAGKYGFFDRRGQIAIPPRFDFAAPFSEGLAAVCEGCEEVSDGEHRFLQGGAWGFIDRTGALVIPARFQEVRPFQKSRAKVKLNGQWQSIGKDGLPLAGK